jgi:hypothetical protein
MADGGLCAAFTSLTASVSPLEFVLTSNILYLVETSNTHPTFNNPQSKIRIPQSSQF